MTQLFWSESYVGINKIYSSLAPLLCNKAVWFVQRSHDIEHPMRELYFSIA